MKELSKRKLRISLENLVNFCLSGGKANLVNYFQKRYLIATYAYENMPEAERILIIARHFSPEIESVLVVVQNMTSVYMIKLLQKFNEISKSTINTNNSQNKFKLKKNQIIILFIIGHFT